jgi:hypothetical protein
LQRNGLVRFHIVAGRSGTCDQGVKMIERIVFAVFWILIIAVVVAWMKK